MQDLNFYSIKIRKRELAIIHSRTRDILLDRTDFNVSAAWAESILEYLKNEKMLVINIVDYYANGEKRRK